jgi:hypothetical protein
MCRLLHQRAMFFTRNSAHFLATSLLQETYTIAIMLKSNRKGNAVKQPRFHLNFGYCYVVETLGLEYPIYKVGKTQDSVRKRIRPASTFAPKGICVHLQQPFYDYATAEDTIHRALAPWHCPPEECGQAKEMFAAPLDTILEVVADHAALQQDFAREQAKMFEELRASGFLVEASGTLIDEILDAKVCGNIPLKSAIIRSINSSSNEEKIRRALLDCGIEVNRKSKVANVVSKEMLGSLCPGSAKLRGVDIALANVSHFNSAGNPIYA